MSDIDGMTTLLNDLETMDKRYGIESMCVAGSMGTAMSSSA